MTTEDWTQLYILLAKASRSEEVMATGGNWWGAESEMKRQVAANFSDQKEDIVKILDDALIIELNK